MDYTNTIISPMITEKSMDNVAKSKFTFKVNKNASKNQIKKTVEKKFKVNVIRIMISNVKGKSKRFGKRRTEVKMANWKKATVELKKGQKIDLFEAGQ